MFNIFSVSFIQIRVSLYKNYIFLSLVLDIAISVRKSLNWYPHDNINIKQVKWRTYKRVRNLYIKGALK